MSVVQCYSVAHIVSVIVRTVNKYTDHKEITKTVYEICTDGIEL